MSGEYGQVYRYEVLPSMLNPEYLLPGGEVDDFQENGKKVFPNLAPYKFADSSFEMYKPGNLADFIKWALKQAPEAKSVVLCFGDHGGGYKLNVDTLKTTRGALYDDNLTGRPCMSVMEIAEALKMLSADELAKLKIINFDCCLMSNMETLGELKDLVPYVIASSHVVASANMGWLVAYMGQSEGDEKLMAQNAVDYIYDVFTNYQENYKIAKEEGRDAENVNLDYTVTDTKKLDALFASIKNVVDYLTSDANAPTLTAKADAYTTAASECYNYVGNTPLYDIVDYLNKLQKNVFPDNAEFAALVQVVKSAAKAAQLGHYDCTFSLDPNEGKNDLGLSYSVTLGCNAGIFSFSDNVKATDIPENWDDMGAVMVTIKGGEGVAGNVYFNEVVFEDGHSYATTWLKDQPVDYTRLNEVDKLISGNVSWAATYNKTAFDKATGWSKWMKKNPGLPKNNPPYRVASSDISDDMADWLEFDYGLDD